MGCLFPQKFGLANKIKESKVNLKKHTRRSFSVEQHFGSLEVTMTISRDRYFDVDHQDYRGESGPSRLSGYPGRRFSGYWGNHEFYDKHWSHVDYFYEQSGFLFSCISIGSDC